MKTTLNHDPCHAVGCGCRQPCVTCRCRTRTAGDRRNQVLVLLGVSAVAMVLFVTMAAYGATGTQRDDKPGLLVIAHGSPTKAWNQAVLAQEQKVRERLGQDNPFVRVKLVFMESTEPNVADGLEELQQAGCRRIVAVPLLIAPSSHSHWDVPALLGIYSDPKVERNLKGEGARVVRCNVPVTLTTTLAQSDVIETTMLKRVRELSSDPNREAVVLLAHGDDETPAAWESFMKRTVTYICGKTGITYADWATVAVGQEYQRAAEVIRTAGEHRDRVIVVGAYLSTGVSRMHKQWMDRFDAQRAGMPGVKNPLKGLNLLLAEQGLLPDEMVTEWIVATAKDELARHP